MPPPIAKHAPKIPNICFRFTKTVYPLYKFVVPYWLNYLLIKELYKKYFIPILTINFIDS